MLWGLVGFVFVMASMALFPRWHWWQQLALALGSATLVVAVFFWVWA